MEIKRNHKSGADVVMTMQKNEDDNLVCTGLKIYFPKGKFNESHPVNSRFFQKLGFGGLLTEARMEYTERFLVEGDVIPKLRTLLTLSKWQKGSGASNDSLYAGLAYLYAQRAEMFSLNVAKLLSEDMSVPLSTTKERIRKAREKGFLSKPGKGLNGQGKVTDKAIQLLEKEGIIMPVPEGIITTTEILQSSGTTVVPPEPEVKDTEEAEDDK
jgi:hypothetical protein